MDQEKDVLFKHWFSRKLKLKLDASSFLCLCFYVYELLRVEVTLFIKGSFFLFEKNSRKKQFLQFFLEYTLSLNHRLLWLRNIYDSEISRMLIA